MMESIPGGTGHDLCAIEGGKECTYYTNVFNAPCGFNL